MTGYVSLDDYPPLYVPRVVANHTELPYITDIYGWPKMQAQCGDILDPKKQEKHHIIRRLQALKESLQKEIREVAFVDETRQGYPQILYRCDAIEVVQKAVGIVIDELRQQTNCPICGVTYCKCGKCHDCEETGRTPPADKGAPMTEPHDPCNSCRYKNQACAYILDGNKPEDACLDKKLSLRKSVPMTEPQKEYIITEEYLSDLQRSIDRLLAYGTFSKDELEQFATINKVLKVVRISHGSTGGADAVLEELLSLIEKESKSEFTSLFVSMRLITDKAKDIRKQQVISDGT
jgi:hypothetical protein